MRTFKQVSCEYQLFNRFDPIRDEIRPRSTGCEADA